MLDGCTNDLFKTYNTIFEKFKGEYNFETTFFSDVLKDGDNKNELNRLMGDNGITDIKYPSYINIKNYLIELARKSKETGSTITKYILYYSGHGSHQENWSWGGDNEARDQVFVFLNESESSYRVMVDDEMLGLMKDFNPNANITSIIDCCHSGTIMDIPSTTDGTMPTMSCISSCSDTQTSALVAGNSIFTSNINRFIRNKSVIKDGNIPLRPMAEWVNDEITNVYSRFAGVNQTTKVTTNISDGSPGLFGKIITDVGAPLVSIVYDVDHNDELTAASAMTATAAVALAAVTVSDANFQKDFSDFIQYIRELIFGK